MNGIKVAIKHNGKIESIKTTDGSIIENIVVDSVSIHRPIHMIPQGISIVKLEIYVFDSDITLVNNPNKTA